eukprot:g21.t1
MDLVSKTTETVPLHLLNQGGHDEILVEIYTYLTLEHARSLASINKRFYKVTTDNKWLPNTLLFSWGNTNHGHGNQQVQMPRMLQKFYTPLLAKQIKSIATSNNGTFLLTHGGQVYCFGKFNVDGSHSFSYNYKEPKLLESIKEYKICDIRVSCPGYFHGNHYTADHISLSALSSDGTFFGWGLNNKRQLFLTENEVLLAEEKYVKEREQYRPGMRQNEAEKDDEDNSDNNNTTFIDREKASNYNQCLRVFRDHYDLEDSVDLSEMQLEGLRVFEGRVWLKHLELMQNFVKIPTIVNTFKRKNEQIEKFSMGIYISAVVTRGINDGISRVYYTNSFGRLRENQRFRNDSHISEENDGNNVCAEAKEFAGREIKQIVCGGWFFCILDYTGNLYTAGNRYGPDISNGNLLGTGDNGSLLYSGHVQPPRLVPFKGYNTSGIKYVSASSYSVLAIAENGQCYTWGDSDGNALGHGNTKCNEPQLLNENIRGNDGSMSYTSGSVCTFNNELLVWGGGEWDAENAISNYSIDSKYSRRIKQVNWGVGKILKGYRVSNLLLGHRHAIIVCKKCTDV